MARRLAAAAIVARANLTPFERPDRLPKAMLAMRPWGTTLAGVVAAAARGIRIGWPSTTTSKHHLPRAVEPCPADRRRPRHPRRRRRRPGRPALPQPSRVRRIPRRRLRDRGRRRPAQHRVRRPAAGRRGRAGGHRDRDPRRRVRRPRLDVRRASARRVRLGRAVPVAGTGPAAAHPGAHGHPHVRHDGQTEGCGSGQRSVRGHRGVAALLERIPFRVGDTQVIAAPLFHAWGLTNLLLGFARCTTNVLARRFDAELTLRPSRATRPTSSSSCPSCCRGSSPSHRRCSCPRPPSPPCHRVERVGAREQAGRERPGSLRPRPLQRVRLDRGGDRDRGDTVGDPRGSRHRRASGVRCARRDPRRARASPCRKDPSAECSSAARCGSRATRRAAGRRRSEVFSRRATSDTSRTDCCSSRAGKTT